MIDLQPTPPIQPMRPILWMLTGLVVVVASFWFGVRWSQKQIIDQLRDEENAEEASVEEATVNEQLDEDGSSLSVSDDAQTLVINWFDPVEAEIGQMNYTMSEVIFGTDPVSPQSIDRVVYDLGTVVGGPYSGSILQMYVAGRDLDSMGGSYSYYYVLMPQSGVGIDTPIIFLDKYASRIEAAFSAPSAQISATELLGEDRFSLYNSVVVLDRGVTIDELEEVEYVTDTSGNQFTFLGEWNRFDYPNDLKLSAGSSTMISDGTRISVAEGGSSFTGLFYRIREDGRILLYDLKSALLVETSGVPVITWGDGTSNSATYSRAAIVGCGYTAPTNVIDPSELGVELVKSGTYAGGDVYEPSSYDVEYFQWWFAGWKLSDETRTMEQFAAIHPFFYVQDSFGRWIQFQHVEVVSGAECGKPVIYLYPEQMMDLDLSLAPIGGFSYTEPVYNNGWRVTASPDGTLVNRDDGQTYSYLFWEGRGGFYSSPTKFWVVSQSEVPSFLSSTLARLGLNEKEVKDFLEFWEPRMQAAPYYKIGFYGTSVMDKIAPLTISQTPDTIIRILMDYEELDVPVMANPPRLPPVPKREGFTVIEWGGVIQ